MFLDRLTEADFVELINICTKGERYISAVDSDNLINSVLISNEPDRCLENGERYYWLRGVKTGDLPKFIGQYKATDFWMVSCEFYAPERDCSSILREFLAKRFGSEYLDKLYDYNVAMALAEKEALAKKVGITR